MHNRKDKVESTERKKGTVPARSVLKRLVSTFFIWLDKQRVIGGSISSHRCYGRFFVLYNDGEKSQPFSYQNREGLRKYIWW